jgi:RHS repeat-associated protein
MYMQARYYDPVIGRFYSNDPMSAIAHLSKGNMHGFGRYTYANNNPYKYTDPDGREGSIIFRQDQRVERFVSGELSSEAYVNEMITDGVAGAIATPIAIAGLACGASGACAAAVTATVATQVGRGKQVGSSIKTDGSTTASSIKAKAESVGFTPIQSANGPLKMVDENGVARVTIKGGSQRAPGSAGAHVELKDSSGQRVNPAGQTVTRKSPENHTKIENDL